jgi:hypothetical protein
MVRLASLAVAALLATVVVPLFAQTGSLKGAWRVIETTTDGKVNAKPEPGLYLFTDRHYSIMRVTEPRKAFPEQPTAQDKVAAFDPFIANSGTYEVKGSQLVTKPAVAKNPNVMTGPGGTSELRFEGANVVVITGPGQGGSTIKLQRVE